MKINIMEYPAIIRHGLVSAEEAAEIFGVPASRVRTIEQILIRSRQKKAGSAGNSARAKKRAIRGTTRKKRSASKTE